MTLRVLGLDLSLTALGIAWTCDRHGNPGPGVRTVSPRTRGHQRLAGLLVEVAAACQCRPHLVVVEGASYGSQGSARWQLAELHGLVKQWLWDNNISYVLVAPQARAKYATGKGNAGKDEVLLAVERRYGQLVTVGDNNGADALVLVAMAADHYGVPLAPVPQMHREALAKVEWPVLNGPPGGVTEGSAARRGPETSMP